MTPPISIVTGFLGSGKTTLLRHLLEHNSGGRRIALIVNELGEVGFDGHIIEGVNVERMVELTSGCICCSIGTDFLLAVEEIIETVDPDLIIVETTGVAEPSGLIRQVRASDLPLDAVVTIVDAANIARELELSPVAAWQLRAADFLVLNKCDLVPAQDLDRVREILHRYNRRAAIFQTVYGALDTDVVFAGTHSASGIAIAHPDTADHLHTDHIDTFLWRNDAPLERQRLETTLRELPATIYRAKGYVHCTDAPWPSLVNVVCGRVDYEATRFKTPPTYLNQLVLIGAHVTEIAPELCGRLDACVDTPERIADWQARRGDG